MKGIYDNVAIRSPSWTIQEEEETEKNKGIKKENNKSA
jgi:hypothetical protein